MKLHALLWWRPDDDRLGSPARDLIGGPANEVLISLVSLWEIVVKARVGKLEGDVGEIATAVRRGGFSTLDNGVPHLMALAGLPMHHRDPFDHLLIAQAITEEATFVSEDRIMARYPVRTVTCSDGR